MPFAFFGLCLEPEKTYSQTVSLSFRISMASFGENVVSNCKRSCVKVEVGGEEFVLCSLSPVSNEQQTLDVVFETGEEITLSVTGENTVHLTGNYLPEEDEHDHEHDDMEYESGDSEEDEEEEGEEDYSDDEEVPAEYLDRLNAILANVQDDEDDSEEDPDFSGSEIEEDDEEDLEEDDEEEDVDEEMSEAELIEVGQKRKAEKACPVADKKMKNNTAAAVKPVQPTKVEKAVQPTKAEKKAEKKAESNTATTESKAASDSPEKPLTKKQRKAAAAKARAEQEAEKSKAKPEENVADVQKSKATPAEKATESPLKKVLGNGLQIEDVKVGTGVRAKKGKKVGVRYIGKLASNGKVFDKNVAGKPFTFNLGRGEVIKGWDMGVDGMSVGGERRLVIPAVLAYGSRGAPPDIPKNANLEFEVKLLSVN